MSTKKNKAVQEKPRVSIYETLGLVGPRQNIRNKPALDRLKALKSALKEKPISSYYFKNNNHYYLGKLTHGNAVSARPLIANPRFGGLVTPINFK